MFAPSTGEMIRIAGGEFRMGSERHHPEEGPVRRVRIGGFWIDAIPVTFAQFAAFVAETGYVTAAERVPDPASYPGVDPRDLVPGSLTFEQPARPVSLDNPLPWWAFTPGVSWRAPYGDSA